MLAAESRMSAHDVIPGSTLLPAPEGLHEVTICALSGEPANPWCPSRAKEWLPAGADGPPCSWHHRTDESLLTVYPPQFRAWEAESHVRTSTDRVAPMLAKRAESRRGSEGTKADLQIANPPDGAIYSYDPTLRREFQALPLRAVTARPTTVRWLARALPA